MSKGKQPATQTQSVEIPKEFKDFVFGGNGVLPQAQRLASQGLLVPSTVMSDTTKRAQAESLNLVDQLQTQFIPSATDLWNRVGNRDLVNSQETRDVIDASTRPIMEQLARYTVPATQDAAIAAGQLGSSRQGIAEGLARSDANAQMSDVAKQIAFGALQEQLQGERMALSFAPQLAQLSALPTTLLSELGQQQEAYDLAARSGQSQNLIQLAQLIQGFIPGASTTQTQTKSKTGLEKLGSALSSGIAGGKLGGLLSAAGGPWGAGIGAVLGGLLG